MSSSQMNLQSVSDEVLKRAIILSIAMNASHPAFPDTTEGGQIVWFDHDAEALFNAVLDEITRRVTERREPFEIDGFEAIGGEPDEVLMITPRGVP
jgi:hypothetical protein